MRERLSKKQPAGMCAIRGRIRLPAISVGLLAMSAAFLLAYVAGAPRSAEAAPPEPCSTSVAGAAVEPLLSHDPTVSVTPNRGPSGTSATLHAWNFLPGQSVNAIFRVTGDPVVATGTVDSQGEAYLQFTVPTAPDGTYWILVAQENRTCVHAAVHFTIGANPPTPTPVPPTATPTTPPTTTTPTTPIVSPTAPPQPPVAGSGTLGNAWVLNSGFAALGLFVMAAGFSFLSLTRRKPDR